MLSDTSASFKISFSTAQPHANCEVLVDDVRKKQFVHGYEETNEFYSACERIVDLSTIENPVDSKLFEDLIAICESMSKAKFHLTGSSSVRLSIKLKKDEAG